MMSDSNYNNERLLAKFLRNECTQEEVSMIENLLREQPELLDALLPDEEWKLEPFPLSIPEEISRNSEQRIYNETGVRINRKKLLPKYGVAVAIASVLLISSALLFKQSEQGIKNLPVASVVLRDSLIKNITKRDMQFNLPDGSVVSLAPESELQMQIPFVTKERALRLNGTGTFDVARDEHHPFTVYAGSTATTALGTKFVVNNKQNGGKINVRLLTGKVKISAVDSGNSFKTVYLNPGEEFSYNKQTGKTIVDVIREQQKVHHQEQELKVETDFNNRPLGEVLVLLEKKYNTKIYFDHMFMNNILFTGSFNDSDSLEQILTTIGELNDLVVQKEGTRFRVTARKE